MKIMIPMEYYEPAFKAGGPVRTVSNLVSLLGNEYAFSIVTRDHDIDGTKLISEREADQWQTVGNAKVHYMKQVSVVKLLGVLKHNNYDVMYFNSFFSLPFTVIPLIFKKLGIIPSVPAIIAPKGEFTTSALSIKKWKKKIYVPIAKKLGLFNNIIWQASSSMEEEEIKAVMGDYVQIITAKDLLPTRNEHVHVSSNKIEGKLSLVFLSRISKMKNLLGALKLLKYLDEGEINFHIYGPIEDRHYWNACEKLIKNLPENIQVEYKGEVKSEQVYSILSKYDLFILPTLGEGFGHAIIESLTSGCPVLISDRTPWRGLDEYNTGWDLPLENEAEFIQVIRHCVAMGQDEHLQLRKNAIEYASKFANDQYEINQHRVLLDTTKALNHD